MFRQNQDTNPVPFDYRRSRLPKLSEQERHELKRRLYLFTNQKSTSKIFQTTVQNVYDAFAGKNIQLLNKIKIYIEKVESRKC